MRTLLNLYQVAMTDPSFIASSLKKKAIVRLTDLIEDSLISQQAMEKLGLTGWQVRWVIRKLLTQDFVDQKKMIACQKKFEKKYWPYISENYQQGPVSDLLYGLSALVFSLDSDKDDIKKISKFIVSRMEKEIVQLNGVWGWLSDDHAETIADSSAIQFGMAHGITNAILALSLLIRLDPSVSKSIERLLEKLAVSFPAVFKMGRVEVIGFCPQVFQPSKINQRVSWCRSDLSTGLALIISGQRLGLKNYVLLGKKFLNRLKKQPRRVLMTDNPYLCHGSSGNFYLYWTAYEKTQDSWFLTQARQTELMTKSFLDQKTFPRKSQIMELQLIDLRNSELTGRSFRQNYSREWDFIFGYREFLPCETEKKIPRQNSKIRIKTPVE
ncbi:MAG: hypothetical protein H7235_02995, partial [Bdellovibrionaceae bacterium]|nr:hypothetical protein [Pseudobdellovibrionaceae bacterium]